MIIFSRFTWNRLPRVAGWSRCPSSAEMWDIPAPLNVAVQWCSSSAFISGARRFDWQWSHWGFLVLPWTCARISQDKTSAIYIVSRYLFTYSPRKQWLNKHRNKLCRNVMAHGDAREGKWRGNWRMQWVGSTLHTTSEHGVSNITTADEHTSAASSRLNWSPPGRFKWTRLFRRKTKSGFCVCAITFQLASVMQLSVN